MSAVLALAYIAVGIVVARRWFQWFVGYWQRTYGYILTFGAGDLVFGLVYAVFMGAIWPAVVFYALIRPWLSSWAERINEVDR